MPSLSVVQVLPSQREERRARGLLAAEPDLAAAQPGHEPLEADRHLDQRAAEVRRDAVDHGRGHQRLADRRVGSPAGAMGVQVLDGHGEVVVGVHQARVGRDDAVPVGVGVVAGGDVVRVLVARSGWPSRSARSSPSGSCRRCRGS